MFELNFDEIKICDDNLSDIEMLKKLIKEHGNDEPFHMFNVADIIRKHQLWLQKMPKVFPYYAVKCNPHPTILKLIAALGGKFDCASKGEIIELMRYGVSSDRILYANPIKQPSHLEYAKKVGVKMTTVDTEDELIKIKKIHPEAKIVIRIKCDANKIAGVLLSQKFGCDPSTDAIQLMKVTIKLGLELLGFSFHVGSPCGEVFAIHRGIKLCKNLIEIARSWGCKNVKMIDIGGGIPGNTTFDLTEFSNVINDALEDVDDSIEVIAEPGRYYVTSAFTLAAYVFGKKTIIKEGEKTFMYYVSDGTYGSFIEELLKLRARHPVPLNNAPGLCSKNYVSTMWGPTCDSCDIILKDELLPEFNIGDWLYWPDFGAYTTSLSSEFNGFNIPKVYPIMRRKDWDFMWNEIRKRQEQNEKTLVS